MPPVNFLGLRPLDRVQVFSKAEIRDARTLASTTSGGFHGWQTNWFYFQHVLPDGRLSLEAPNGVSEHLAAEDVCDIRRGEPIAVRALTEASFIELSRRPLAARSTPAPDDAYAAAFVCWVEKDSWGRLGRVGVWFADESNNSRGRSVSFGVHREDLQMLAGQARRTRMPVRKDFLGRGSADHGLRAQSDLYRLASQALVRAGCGSSANPGIRRSICEIDASPKAVTSAAVNKLVRSLA